VGGLVQSAANEKKADPRLSYLSMGSSYPWITAGRRSPRISHAVGGIRSGMNGRYGTWHFILAQINSVQQEIKLFFTI